MLRGKICALVSMSSVGRGVKPFCALEVRLKNQMTEKPDEHCGAEGHDSWGTLISYQSSPGV